MAAGGLGRAFAPTVAVLLMAGVVGKPAPPAVAGGADGSIRSSRRESRRLWVSRIRPAYSGTALAVAPDGTRVYVAGTDDTGTFLAVAQDSSTGRVLWAQDDTDGQVATDIGTSLDGGVVYVTGTARGQDGSLGDYRTVAYDAATGVQQWVAVYDGPDGDGDAGDYAGLLAVDATGNRVFVSGESWSPDSYFDYATVAYDASTGAELWSSRYNGKGSGDDNPHGLEVKPDGQLVYVTGESWGITYNDYATVAYDTSSGAQVWAVGYNNPAKRGDTAYALAMSPDGTRLFVTGCEGVADYCVEADVVSIAYDAATGDQLWLARFDGPGHGVDTGLAIGTSPDGDDVYVAATSRGVGGVSNDYAVLKYLAATGTLLWRGVFNGGGNANDEVADLGVAPDGLTVFVTRQSGDSQDYGTVAFSTETGRRVWSELYDGPGHLSDVPNAVAVGPDGRAIYVTGTSVGADLGYDLATVAYRG
jgi:PQQ-like domain